jgi:hypothetical protein
MLRRALHFGIRTGTAATACMSLIVLGSQLARVYRGRHGPVKIADGIMEGMPGKRQHGRERALVTTVAYESYGVAAASLFACLWHKFGPKRRCPLVHGMLFSLGWWGLRSKGWVPGLNLMPSPKRDHPGRVVTNIASHLVYGAVLGANARNLEAARGRA